MKCADVTFAMADEHYRESTSEARDGDLVWDLKGGDEQGHVISGQRIVQFGWEDPWPVPTCQCDRVDLLDHHVVMLARLAR